MKGKRRQTAGRQGGRPRKVAIRGEYPDLATYLAESGETQVALSRRIGIPQAALSKIAAGRIFPGPDVQWAIHEACRVPWSSFALVYLLKRGLA